MTHDMLIPGRSFHIDKLRAFFWSLPASEQRDAWETWQRARDAARMDTCRDLSALTPQLIGLEGWRVAVTTKHGEAYRFIVGKSTGWRPCHLEIRTVRSTGGMAASKEYASVRKIEKVH